ncbi:MAG: hypothetical protein ANABAC_3305 [Anaerolineae bacterium]|jgi:prevent-host-death family protein|nr:MAG: hypothetical protein ANABAC_3305 [Anaerolineae bacterium]
MTEEIGIRELKARASALVRAVREKRARYIITQRGKPVALLIPMDASLPVPTEDEIWARLEKIRQELGKGWQSEKSAVEILAEMRR